MLHIPRETKYGEYNTMTPRLRNSLENMAPLHKEKSKSPRSSKSSTANNTPRQLRPLQTPVSNTESRGGSTWAEESEDVLEDSRRRYHLDRTNLIKIDANGSVCKPADFLVSEGILQPQITGLKNFDVLIPGVTTMSECRSQQREYLRMYYSDYIGQRTVEKPPFPPDSDVWEADALQEFLTSCRPRTRIDAYPLLLVTQEVLRRMTEKEIKLVNSRADELLKELANANMKIDQLKLQQLELATLVEAQRQELESSQTDGRNKLQREKLFSIMQRGLQSTVQSKNLDKISKHKAEVLDLQYKIIYLESEIGEKNGLLKKAEDDFQHHLRQEASKKPLDFFLSWHREDRKSIISYALSDSSCLHSVGGLERCLELLSRQSEPLFLFKILLQREFATEGDKTNLIHHLQRVLHQFVKIATAEAEIQTEPIENERAQQLPQPPGCDSAGFLQNETDTAQAESNSFAPEEFSTFEELMASMADLNQQLDHRLDNALHLNEEFNTDELSSELKAVKNLVRQLSRNCAQMLSFKPKEQAEKEQQCVSPSHEEIQKPTKEVTALAKNVNDVPIKFEALPEKQSSEHPETVLKDDGAALKPTAAAVNYLNVRLHDVITYRRQLSKDCKAMQIEQCLRVIHEAYQSRLIQDVKDGAAAGRKRQPFDAYFKDFLVRKSGLRSIATKQLCSIAMCVDKDSVKNPRIRMFGEIAGFIDGPNWTPLISDFAFGVLNLVCEFEGRDLSGVGEWLDGNSEPGVTVQAAVHALKDMSLSGPIPFQEVDVSGLCALPKNSNGSIVIEQLLLWCMDFCRKIQNMRKEEFMALFSMNDKNGDGESSFSSCSLHLDPDSWNIRAGVLDFREFEALIKTIVQSDTSLIIDRQDIFEMYHEALKDNAQGESTDCLSKEAFSDLMLKRGFKHSAK